MSDAIDNFGLSCPPEAKFYICKDKPTQFIGCCTSDPCKSVDGSCPSSDLRTASFDSASFNKIPEQECISTDPEVKWYTCAETEPPFLGCCGQNPCSIGSCPTKSLRGAKLSSDEEKASTFISGGESMSALPFASKTAIETSTLSVGSRTASSTAPSTVSSTALSISSVATTSTATPQKTSVPVVESKGHGLSKGAIVGVGIASTVVAVLFIGLTILCLMKRKRRNSPSQTTRSAPSQILRKETFREHDYSSIPSWPNEVPYRPPRPQHPYFHHPSPRRFNQHHELGHTPAYYTIYPDGTHPARTFSPQPYRNYMNTPPSHTRGGFAPAPGHLAPAHMPFTHPRTPPLPEASSETVATKHSISAMGEYFTRRRTEVAELGTSNEH